MQKIQYFCNKSMNTKSKYNCINLMLISLVILSCYGQTTNSSEIEGQINSLKKSLNEICVDSYNYNQSSSQCQCKQKYILFNQTQRNQCQQCHNLLYNEVTQKCQPCLYYLNKKCLFNCTEIQNAKGYQTEKNAILVQKCSCQPGYDWKSRQCVKNNGVVIGLAVGCGLFGVLLLILGFYWIIKIRKASIKKEEQGNMPINNGNTDKSAPTNEIMVL